MTISGETVQTFSGTTHVKWLPDAYHGPDGSRGIWFADDDRYQGVWGEGDTPDAALDDWCDVLRGWWSLHEDTSDLPCIATYSGSSAHEETT